MVDFAALMRRRGGFCARRTLSAHFSLAACRRLPLRPDRGCLSFSLRIIDDEASSLCVISRFMATINVYAYQARIILAVHGFEASVAQAPGLRQTTAHPEPERVITETRAWAGRFQPTDGPRSRRARSKGRCGIHV